MSFQRLLLKANDGLLWTFANIQEVFLWGFLAQDVVSMWLPRIWGSLDRGRETYDPTTDPANKGLTPTQLVWKYIDKNIEGLNWTNFTEETLREFATGPGVLMIPTLAYSLARRQFGLSAVELSHGSLTKLTESFRKFLERPESPLHQFNQSFTVEELRKAYTQELQAFLQQVVNVEGYGQAFGKTFSKEMAQPPFQMIQELRNAYTPEVQKFLQQVAKFEDHEQAIEKIFSKKIFSKMIQEPLNAYTPEVQKFLQLVAKFENHEQAFGKTFSKEMAQTPFQAFEAELKNWTHQVFDESKPLKEINKALTEIEGKIRNVLVEGINRPFFQTEMLHNLDRIPLKLLQKDGSFQTEWISASKFLHDIHNWKDLITTALKEKLSGGPGRTAVKETFVELIGKAQEKLIVKRGLYALSVTALTAPYLALLAKLAQRHEDYEANRLLKLPVDGVLPEKSPNKEEELPYNLIHPPFKMNPAVSSPTALKQTNNENGMALPPDLQELLGLVKDPAPQPVLPILPPRQNPAPYWNNPYSPQPQAPVYGWGPSAFYGQPTIHPNVYAPTPTNYGGMRVW